MMKKILTIAFCVALVFAMRTVSYARFTDSGAWSESGARQDFMLDTDNAVIIYGSGEFDYNFYPMEFGSYRNIRPGSVMWIPILSDLTRDIATMAVIGEETVSASFRATRFVDNAAIRDGTEANSTDVLPGAHLRIEFTDTLVDINSQGFSAQFVLVFNGVADQHTMIRIQDSLRNREIIISRNSVYAVFDPAVILTSSYSGDTVFDFGPRSNSDNRGIRYSTTVASNAGYYLNLDRNPIRSVQEMYSAGGRGRTHMEYYNFRGDFATFPGVGELQIPIDRDAFAPRRNDPAQVYVYSYTNGRLTAVPSSQMSFDANRDILTIFTASLDTYVLSAQALLSEVDETIDDIIRSGYAPSPHDAEPPMEPPVDPDTPVPGPPPDWGGNNNPITGGDTLFASNQAAANPPTSDTRVFWPAAALGIASLAVVIGGAMKVSRPARGRSAAAPAPDSKGD